MLEIDVEASSSAAPERVWALLADVGSWPTWAPFDDAQVESGQGVGEIRRFRSGRVTSRERVVALEPPRRFAYEFLSGLPIRDYQAEVTLAPTAEAGTAIRWRSSFRAKIPGTGWVLRRNLTKFIAKTAEGLAREAEQRAHG
ncbi:MAG: SRPBCC family protein [Actinobacteria bacterium]|nr:MAG: SRPBCC family protein [Actinomycetota bacterium]